MVDMNRYARHISLPDVGIEGQQLINKSRILVVGAGGLASPVLLYLAAAGVGEIGIIDDDLVDLSNLQRQIIHAEANVGVSKVESAKAQIMAINSTIKVTTWNVRLSPDNAQNILTSWDIVIDGTDNIPTRYLIDETCKNLGIPWVYGSVYRFEGQVSVFNYNGGPTYQDLFPEPPPEDLLPSCSEAGVLGVLPGLIGSLQANEVIKIIVGIGKPLSGQLLIYDALESTQKTLKFGNSMNEHVEEPSATQSQVMFHEIDSANAIAKMKEGWSPYFIDVRSEQENNDARISKAVDLCPHTEILSAIDRIPKDVDVLVHCRSGMRSQLAIMQLIEAGYDGAKMYNLSGGIIGWVEVDPEGIIQG